jgi:hypothetical protein
MWPMCERHFAPSCFALGLMAAVGCDSAAPAYAQQSSLPAVDNNGQDFTRPENLFQIRNLYQTAPANGSVPGTLRTVTTDMTILRADGVMALAPQWSIALRGDLPFVTRNPLTADNPGGQYVYGLGDADIQAALIRQFDSRWAAGAGLLRCSNGSRRHHRRQMADAPRHWCALFTSGVEHRQLR